MGIKIIVQIAEAYGMKDNILACAMALHDMFLATHYQLRISRSRQCGSNWGRHINLDPTWCQYQFTTKLVAVACFMLANKFVGSSSLWIDDILGVVRLKCSSAEIQSTEGMVLSSIDWSLYLATGEACLH
jgi:hypothetical protein